MSRLPEVKREDLRAEDQVYYDEIVESRGGLRGPFPALIHSPQLAARVAATGHYARFDCVLPQPLREVVTLATAKEAGNQYVFTAHARLARQVEVAESTIDALKRGDTPEGTPRDDAMVMQFVRELLRDHKVSDASFNAVTERFGVQGAVDLVGILGHYLFVIQVINAFDIQVAEGVTPELPA